MLHSHCAEHVFNGGIQNMQNNMNMQHLTEHSDVLLVRKSASAQDAKVL